MKQIFKIKFIKMKKSILSIFAVASIFFTSCTSDDSNNDDNTDAFEVVPSEFGGTIAEGQDVVLDSSVEYTLTNALIVESGASLTIPAGTVIKAESRDLGANYIAVSQGGEIFINGTSSDPVIMTSAEASPAQGDWGGLLICGNGITNTGEDSISEVGGLSYGGSDNTDDSGSISYLQVEYTGAGSVAGSEFNGISLFAVGSGTEFDNVYTLEAGDDGIEFFGGAVAATNLTIENSYDDSLDFADGFVGSVNGLYITGVTKAGIEGSNNGTDEAATPETTATITNATVIMGAGFAGSENVINYKEGGGTQTYTNLKVEGFATLAKYSSDDTSTANVTAGKFTIVSYTSDATLSDDKGILTGVTNDAALIGAGVKATWIK